MGLAEIEVALIKLKRKNKTKQNPTEKKRAMTVSCLLPLLTAK